MASHSDIVQSSSLAESPPDTRPAADTVRSISSRYRVEQADPVHHGKPINMLIKRMYSWRGLSATSTNFAQVNPHQITLITSSEEEVFGTITLSLDSPERLLADQLYPGELNFFRRRGHRICELTRLAVDIPHRSKEVLGALFHLAYIHARLIHDVTDAFIEVHPRHAPFYRRMLGFEQIGPERICERVNAPAVLLHVELQHMDEQIRLHGGSAGGNTRTLYSHFFSVEQQTSLRRQLATH